MYTSFNQNISSWKTGNVAVMYGMFAYTTHFNQNLSGWNVINVYSYDTFREGNKYTYDICIFATTFSVMKCL